METSDSECFESADEEFASDNEDSSCKLTLPLEAMNLEKLRIREDESLNITEDKYVSTEKESPKINQLYNSTPAEKDNSHLSATSAMHKTVVNKTDRKGRLSRSTLGVKLGTKIKLNFSPQFDEKKPVKTKSDYDAPSARHKVKRTSNIGCGYQACSREGSEVAVQLVRDECRNNDQEFKNSLSKKCENQEENMWYNDDWEPAPPIIDQSHKKNLDDCSSDWTDWGNWGVTSLLSTATMGVTTIRNHVSQGLTTVLESSIGVPDPEELARLHKAENKSQELDNSENKDINVTTSDLTFGLGSFVSGVTQITKLVETTGNKVISSGLDTLETIGKKTMEVLQEGDPGLKKKRAFLKIEADTPVLSQILREAKEKAEYENKLLEERHYCRKANYETLFDDHQGLVHLEALEMLSKQCDIKLQTLLESQTGNDLIEMQETMSQIKELCEITENEDEIILPTIEIENKLNAAASEMNIPISYSKLVSTWVEADQWLNNLNLNVCNKMELHEQSINILAQLTAIAVELFHKSGELLLIKEHRSTVDEADSLVQITNTMTTLISNAARKVTDKLNEKATHSTNKDNINGLITNVYYEATNSSSYIKNAFQLLIPVLQVGAV